jgi:prolyl 4-hydroxylase
MNWLKSLFISKQIKSNIIVIDNFLSKEKCQQLIDLLNNYSFSKAHQYENGRCNKEVFIEDDKIKSIFLEQIKKLRLSGFKKILEYHEPFEFYKYEIGDFILPHEDSSIIFESGEESNFTALVYLNDDFFGGSTFFTNLNKKITPKSGTLLLFKHNLVHESQKIEYGTKYIYRSNWLIG